jgi:hypothetical protein
MKKVIFALVAILLSLTALQCARQWRGFAECTPHYWLCSTVPNTATVTDSIHVKNEGTVTNGIALEGAYTADIALQNANTITNGAAGTVTINADVDATGGYKQQLNYWYQENVVAAQTDVVLDMDGNALRAEVPTVMAGSVVGIAVYSNAACTVNGLTVEVTIDGVGTGLTTVLDAVTNPQTNTTTQARNLDAFTAGQRIGVTVTTTAGWLPVTADITATVLVEQ